MKIIILCLSIGLVFANSIRIETRDLKTDLNDFAQLIPLDKVQAIFTDYLLHDPDFIQQLGSLQTPEVKALVEKIDNLQELKDFLNYLKANGFPNIYDIINAIHEILGIPPIKPTLLEELDVLIDPRKTGTGIQGFLDEVEAILPKEEIANLYKTKLTTSQSFKEFIDYLKGSSFKVIIATIESDPTYKQLEDKARADGIKVDAYKAFLNKLFGW